VFKSTTRPPLCPSLSRRGKGVFKLLLWLVVCLVLISPLLAASKKPARSKPVKDVSNSLDNIGVDGSGGTAQVILQSAKPLKYREDYRDEPPSLYIYMTAPTESKLPGIQKLDGDLVDEVRAVYKGNGALDHILIKTKRPFSRRFTQKDWILKVELRGKGKVVEKPKVEVLGSAPTVPGLPSRKEKKLWALPPTPTLQDFLDVGMHNHVPLRLAQEEYAIAKVRYFEATRNLFPSLTGRYTRSEGFLLLDPSTTTDDTSFQRREYGLQIGQPIFQSGRLFYSQRQASMQKQISQQNLFKTQQNIVYDIKRAYYNLIKAQKTLKARRELIVETDKIIDTSRKKRQLEIISESEGLGAESQATQIAYRGVSDEKDLALARMKIAALLNLPGEMPLMVPEPPDNIDIKAMPSLDADVSYVIEQAKQHRPELILAGYSARFHKYGEMVAKADNRLRVDASAFLGRGAAAFETEPLEFHRSWNVGIQAKTYFIGNSVKGNRTRDRTAPDLGETGTTETDAYSMEVGFLDGLKVLSDARQAQVAKDRAAAEYEQARRQMEMDVQEAYYDIDKGILQLKAAKQEMDFRLKELTIARQKERLNLIEPSQRLAAESSYTEAVSSYEDAVAFYKISLAALDKAVGIPMDFVIKTPKQP